MAKKANNSEHYFFNAYSTTYQKIDPDQQDLEREEDEIIRHSLCSFNPSVAIILVRLLLLWGNKTGFVVRV